MSKTELLIVFQDSCLKREDQRNLKIVRILRNFPVLLEEGGEFPPAS